MNTTVGALFRKLSLESGSGFCSENLKFLSSHRVVWGDEGGVPQ